jgi:hypothetical protein
MARLLEEVKDDPDRLRVFKATQKVMEENREVLARLAKS